MTRPEHVRCENCCYWHRFDKRPRLETSPEGECRREPFNAVGLVFSVTPANADFWCGEFLEDWPGSEKATIPPRAIELPCPHCSGLVSLDFPVPVEITKV